MIKNIIFDLDGTLANTSKDIIDSLNYSLKKLGFKKKVNHNLFKQIANRGSLYMIKSLVKKDRVIIRNLNNNFLIHYKKNICKKIKLKKNIIQFLKICKKKNISLFVSTNKNKKNAILILRKLKILHFFKFIAGSDTFKYRKPNPLHLELLKNKFSIIKKETVFIGDSEIDSLMANKFKIKFILIKYGYTLLKPHQIKSDLVIKDYSNIIRIFKILSSF
mgnify:CR=1 FL=1